MSANDHTDAEFARREHDAELGGDTQSDLAWLRWLKEAKALGADFLRTGNGKASLDGDEAVDGYSLDFAHDAFEAGDTPAFYIAQVRKTRRAELGL